MGKYEREKLTYFQDLRTYCTQNLLTMTFLFIPSISLLLLLLLLLLRKLMYYRNREKENWIEECQIYFHIFLFFDIKQKLNCIAINCAASTDKREIETCHERECFQRSSVLSLNRVSPRSSCLKGHIGFASTNGKGRCARDEAEGDRPMQGMRDGRPTERKRYETAVLVLCRQVLVYRSIQTPSNTVSELCTLPEQGCSSRCVTSNELPLVCRIINLISIYLKEILCSRLLRLIIFC